MQVRLFQCFFRFLFHVKGEKKTNNNLIKIISREQKMLKQKKKRIENNGVSSSFRASIFVGRISFFFSLYFLNPNSNKIHVRYNEKSVIFWKLVFCYCNIYYFTNDVHLVNDHNHTLTFMWTMILFFIFYPLLASIKVIFKRKLYHCNC